MIPISYTYYEADAKKLLRTLSRDMVGFDIETAKNGTTGSSGLDVFSNSTRLIQLSDGERNLVFDMFYIPMFQELYELLVDPTVIKSAHNMAFEYRQMLYQYKIAIKNHFCTMLASQVLRNGIADRHGLKDVAKAELNIDMDKTMQTFDYSQPLTQEAVDYAGYDAYVTHALCNHFIGYIQQHGDKYTNTIALEMRGIPTFVQMELNGLYWDMGKLQNLGEKIKEEYTDYLTQAQNSLPPLDLRLKKPDQGKSNEWWTATGKPTKKHRELCPTGYKAPTTLPEFKLVYKQAGIAVPTKKDGKESLSKETFGRIQHPSGLLLKKWNSSKHIHSTYIKGALPQNIIKNKQITGVDYGWFNPTTGKVHPGIRQCGTVTGRISMSDPNFQNIPRKETRFRPLLYAPEGWSIVKADYSQIEMRVMAEISKDRNMIDAYINNKDVHSMTAGGIYKRPVEAYKDYDTVKALKEERQLGKNVNFGSLYGQGAYGLKDYLWREADLDYTQDQCKMFLQAFFDTYPGIKVYHDTVRKHVIDTAGQTGYYEAQTLCGRIRHWNDVSVTPRVNRYTGETWYSVRHNEMLNLPVQGTVGDVMKFCMIRVHKELLPRYNELSFLILQVHDELVLLVHDSVRDEVANDLHNIMVEEMSKVIRSVPIKVDVTIGVNWNGDQDRSALNGTFRECNGIRHRFRAVGFTHAN